VKKIEDSHPNTDLPEGWVWCGLREIAQIKYGKGLTKENRKEGKSAVYGSNGIVGFHDRPLSKGPTVVIGRKGSIGEVNYSSIGCWPIDTTYFIDNLVFVDPVYLFLVLRNSRLGGLDKSTAIPGVNRNDLYLVSIPFAPLSEQRLIVARVEALLKQLREAKESLENVTKVMKGFRQAVLKEAFSGELTTEWRRRHHQLEPATQLLKRTQKERKQQYEQAVRRAKAEGRRPPGKPKSLEAQPLDTSHLPGLPEKWRWVRLGDIETFVGSGITPRGGRSNYLSVGIPFIRSQNVWPEGLRLHDVVHISEKQNQKMSRTKAYPGDVLLNITGASIGRSTYIPEEVPEANVNQHVCIIRTPKITDYRYLSNFLNSPFAQEEIFATQAGVTREGLNYNQVRNLRIPLPPADEQQVVVQQVEALFSLANEIQEGLEETRRRMKDLAQSILSNAFSGELTSDFREAVKNWRSLDQETRRNYAFILPQEEQEKVLHSDEFPMEPAVQLLERIQEQRGRRLRRKKTTRARRKKR